MATGEPFWTLTPSGSTVGVELRSVDRHPDRDLERHWVSVQSDSRAPELLCVGIPAPSLVNVTLTQAGLPGLQDVREKIVMVAAIKAFDHFETLPIEDQAPLVLVDGEDAVRILTPGRPNDREIRRWLARRLHLTYSRGTLNESTIIGEIEMAVLGITLIDLMRNSQLLEAEGYLRLQASTQHTITLQPIAKLIREVERYGAAKADAVSETDFLAALAAYPALGSFTEALTLEFRRFNAATTQAELHSSFRAVAPIVESILKELLRAHGSSKDHASIGPAIQECQHRRIGGVALYSQLDHILRFGRDLAQHGAQLPESVLRIACANAFELVPQLASLFPR